MLSTFYCYADEPSISALTSVDEKIVLLGSDFGYGNFGDIAQMMNTISFHKEMGRHRCIIVMAIDAIGDARFPEFVRQSYNVDGVIFVSPHPVDLSDSGVPLQSIRTVRNVGAMHLYGGGFLNDKWGDFVLGVTEYFLQLLQPSVYVASGEQVTTPFEARLLEHIPKYRPALFGVRDDLSHKWMMDAGYEPSFSFDDATESLQKLTANLPLRHGPGLLVHLNVSGYTSNATDPAGIPRELAALRTRVGDAARVTMLQAYSDRRLEVFDTRESLKELERALPFAEYQTLELAQLAYQGWPRLLSSSVQGEIGFSCSYHVALWLQLAGIPCWLRGSNLFYQQKRSALQVDQDLGAFLREPKLADHSINLERREAWLQQLRAVMTSAPAFHRSFDLPSPEGLQAAAWKFKGNRMRQWQEQAEWMRQRTETLSARVNELESLGQSQQQRADALSAQVQELDIARKQAEDALLIEQRRSEDALLIEQRRTEDALTEVDGLRAQILGLTSKVTELGSRTHAERQRAENSLEEVARYYAQTRELNSIIQGEQQRVSALSSQVAEKALLLQTESQRANQALALSNQIIRSRTWRWTKPLRFGARVIRGDWSSALDGLRRLRQKS